MTKPRRHRNLRPFALLVMLFALMTAEGPAALAQDAPAPTAGSTAPDAPAPTGEAGAAEALIRILEDETARARLVEDLRRIARPAAEAGAEPPAHAAPAGLPALMRPLTGAPAAESPAAGPEPAAEEDRSFARELGVYTQRLAQDASEVAIKVGRGILNFTRLFDGSADINWERLQGNVIAVAVLALMVFGAFAASGFAVHFAVNMLERWVAGRTVLIRSAGLVGAILLKLVPVALGWAAALVYLVANAANGAVDLVQTLFVNAFLLTQTIKVGLAALFMPSRPGLRLAPMGDEMARYWYGRLARLVEFMGFGVMLAVPMTTAAAGLAVGLGLRMAIVLATLVIAILLVLRNRERVRAGLVRAAGRVQGKATGAVLAMLAHIWHLLVIGYVAVAFLVWVTRPFDAINYMAAATFETLVVLLVGGTLAAALSRMIARGVRLPPDVTRALPSLESRVNLVIPTVLRVLRFALMLVMVGLVLAAWQLADVVAWAATPAGADLIGRFASAFLVTVIAMAVWIAATAWIEFRLSPSSGRVSTARARTLFSLLRNALTIVIAVIAAMLALSELGVDIAPLIAGAGVVGLAVGFGSQKLVQDIITGAFIQFENAMNEGDVVTVAGISGVVDRLTIRSVSLRDIDGVYHVIPFSSVDAVSNFMRGFAFHVAALSVAYKEDIGEVKRLMHVAFDRLMKTDRSAHILEPLEMQGVVEFGANAIVVRARIKTLPGKQWDVGRTYNEIVKSVFDENGAEIPFPQTKVWFAADDTAAPQPSHARKAAPADRAPRPEQNRLAGPKATPAETLDLPESPDDDGNR